MYPTKKLKKKKKSKQETLAWFYAVRLHYLLSAAQAYFLTSWAHDHPGANHASPSSTAPHFPAKPVGVDPCSGNTYVAYGKDFGDSSSGWKAGELKKAW